jgi:hypothetical protein
MVLSFITINVLSTHSFDFILGSWLLLVRSVLSGQSANQLRYRPKAALFAIGYRYRILTLKQTTFKCFADHQILTEFQKMKKRASIQQEQHIP